MLCSLSPPGPRVNEPRQAGRAAHHVVRRRLIKNTKIITQIYHKYFGHSYPRGDLNASPNYHKYFAHHPRRVQKGELCKINKKKAVVYYKPRACLPSPPPPPSHRMPSGLTEQRVQRSHNSSSFIRFVLSLPLPLSRFQRPTSNNFSFRRGLEPPNNQPSSRDVPVHRPNFSTPHH